MSFKRQHLHLLVLSISAILLFVAGGARVFRSSNHFVPVYTGARCLLHGCNPYDTSQLEQQFYLAGGHATDLPSWDIDVPVYPPSTFLVLSPLALFSFPAARLIWFLLNGCLFVAATGLILALCPPSHRWLATALGSLFLLSSAILLVLGQPAIFAISLLGIGIYLFLRGLLLPLGTLLLILSLAVKPQVGGLIVLYLVARRLHWALRYCGSGGRTRVASRRGLDSPASSAQCRLGFHSPRKPHGNLGYWRQCRPQACESTSHRRYQSAIPYQHFLTQRPQV